MFGLQRILAIMVVRIINNRNHEWFTIGNSMPDTIAMEKGTHTQRHTHAQTQIRLFISSLTISLHLSCPVARHTDIVVAAEAGPSRDPCVEERHHW